MKLSNPVTRVMGHARPRVGVALAVAITHVLTVMVLDMPPLTTTVYKSLQDATTAMDMATCGVPRVVAAAG